ncbi:MAG: carbamate kinase [Melioribacteraceae bacterium]|nr:carbamate kinase [Melioribacteraceae bacterium]
MKKLAVVAFGGNALLRGNEVGTIEQQEKNTYDACKSLLGLINSDYNIIITHGNGPQVGNILLKNEAGFNEFKLPKMPLDVCVADSQGQIGYMIERSMRNVLKEEGIDKNVVVIVSQVFVDKNDPAFENPTKPIGPFYLKEEADLITKSSKWVFKKDSKNRGWRRVVASPIPLGIMNTPVIKKLAEEGNIVIAVGGSGIPIYLHKNGYHEAIEAVIDKDLASAFLAKEIDADNFYIVTDVPKVCINFNTPSEQKLDRISVAEVKKLLHEGQFPYGSMGPKVKAAILFAESSGKEAVITNQEELELDNCGTRIYKSN